MGNFYIKSGATSGSGNSDVVISTTSANKGRESLSGRFKVTFDNKKFATISLEQRGIGEALDILSYTQSVGAKDSVVSITGVANVNTILVSPSVKDPSIPTNIRVNGVVENNWDGVNKIFIAGDPGRKAMYSYIITVHIGENTSSRSRNIQIMVSDGDEITHSLNVTQLGTGDAPQPPSDKYIYFGNSQDNVVINFSQNGGTQITQINSNASWKLMT